AVFAVTAQDERMHWGAFSEKSAIRRLDLPWAEKGGTKRVVKRGGCAKPRGIVSIVLFRIRDVLHGRAEGFQITGKNGRIDNGVQGSLGSVSRRSGPISEVLGVIDDLCLEDLRQVIENSGIDYLHGPQRLFRHAVGVVRD